MQNKFTKFISKNLWLKFSDILKKYLFNLKLVNMNNMLVDITLKNSLYNKLKQILVIVSINKQYLFIIIPRVFSVLQISYKYQKINELN